MLKKIPPRWGIVNIGLLWVSQPEKIAENSTCRISKDTGLNLSPALNTATFPACWRWVSAWCIYGMEPCFNPCSNDLTGHESAADTFSRAAQHKTLTKKTTTVNPALYNMVIHLSYLTAVVNIHFLFMEEQIGRSHTRNKDTHSEGHDIFCSVLLLGWFLHGWSLLVCYFNGSYYLMVLYGSVQYIFISVSTIKSTKIVKCTVYPLFWPFCKGT